jgi:hypothetical protein
MRFLNVDVEVQSMRRGEELGNKSLIRHHSLTDAEVER